MKYQKEHNVDTSKLLVENIEYVGRFPSYLRVIKVRLHPHPSTLDVCPKYSAKYVIGDFKPKIGQESIYIEESLKWNA